MEESERSNVWVMLLWLQKNKIHVSTHDQKNVFIVREYKLVKKLKEMYDQNRSEFPIE